MNDETLFDTGPYDLLRKFYDDCIANLDDSYELIHIDYRDGLTDDQVDYLAAGDWEALWDSIEEWESESRYEGMDWHRNEVIEYVHRLWEEQHDEDVARDVRQEFEVSDWNEELRWQIEDRDTSNPIRDLAGNTGRVLMRQVMGEPVLYTEFTIGGCLDALGLPDNEQNWTAIARTADEAGQYMAAMIVYAVDVSDLYDTQNADEVEVVNPFLYLGNPYMGDGYCEERLAGVVRLKRDELTTDKSAFGYGWDEVAGVVTSAYECGFRAVAKPATDEAVTA